jgi:hypothetical protein
MKCQAKGNSTVIVYEQKDYMRIEEQGRVRDHRKLDRGGEVIVCSQTGECRSTSRPSGESSTAK